MARTDFYIGSWMYITKQDFKKLAEEYTKQGQRIPLGLTQRRQLLLIAHSLMDVANAKGDIKAYDKRRYEIFFRYLPRIEECITTSHYDRIPKFVTPSMEQRNYGIFDKQTGEAPARVNANSLQDC
jgi:hypothetical protein